MAHLAVIGFYAIAGDDHFVWIAENDPIQALIVFAAKGDHLVEIRTRQQDFRIRDMKNFADLDKTLDDLAETSLLNGEWDDLGHGAYRELCSPS